MISSNHYVFSCYTTVIVSPGVETENQYGGCYITQRMHTPLQTLDLPTTSTNTKHRSARFQVTVSGYYNDVSTARSGKLTQLNSMLHCTTTLLLTSQDTSSLPVGVLSGFGWVGVGEPTQNKHPQAMGL